MVGKSTLGRRYHDAVLPLSTDQLKYTDPSTDGSHACFQDIRGEH